MPNPRSSTRPCQLRDCAWGAIRSQVNNGPVTVYEAAQSFFELPGDRHSVSANASERQPAKLLAVFVVDTNETELTIPFGN
jgi:quercetin dioxygenase-like cupin family protein